MKTAEEIFDVLDSASRTGIPPTKETLEYIRLVQQESIKHGMTLAADVAYRELARQKRDEEIAEPDFTSEAILQLRDNFKLI